MEDEVQKPKIVAKAVIEIVGFPSEHVKETLELVLKRIKDSKFKLRSQNINDPISVSDKFFSGFIEVEIEFKDLDILMGFVMDYMPSSIEIYEPEIWTEDVKKLNYFVNDMIAKLHTYDSQLKTLKAKNIVLTKELAKYKPAETTESKPVVQSKSN